MKRQLTLGALLVVSGTGLLACDKGPTQLQATDVERRQVPPPPPPPTIGQNEPGQRAQPPPASARAADAQVAPGPASASRGPVAAPTPPAGAVEEEPPGAERESIVPAPERPERRPEFEAEAAEARRMRAQESTIQETRAVVERAEIMRDTRVRLEQLDKRAAQLRDQADQGIVDNVTQINAALARFQTQRRDVERDLDALNAISAANLNRVRDRVERKLSSIDRTLSPAESNR